MTDTSRTSTYYFYTGSMSTADMVSAFGYICSENSIHVQTGIDKYIITGTLYTEYKIHYVEYIIQGK